MSIQAVVAEAQQSPGATPVASDLPTDRDANRLRRLEELMKLPAVEVGSSLRAALDDSNLIAVSIEFELDRDDLICEFVQQIHSLLESVASRTVFSSANCQRISQLANHVGAVRQAIDDVQRAPEVR